MAGDEEFDKMVSDYTSSSKWDDLKPLHIFLVSACVCLYVDVCDGVWMCVDVCACVCLCVLVCACVCLHEDFDQMVYNSTISSKRNDLEPFHIVFW